MKHRTSYIVHRTSYVLRTSYVHRTSFSTLIFLFFSFLSYSQSDSCHLRFSLLTCSPGAELYSAWGHTAIRVTDRNTGLDMVYNYGTFDDSDPEFYLRFTKGIMHYALSVYPFADFLQEYQFQGRGIVEQTLDLTCAEKIRIFNALQENNTDENRFYYYYFHTDNCTTRAKDMILKNTNGPVSIRNIVPVNSVTYRNLIHAYLDEGGQYWSKFGVDLFLGMNLDKKVTNEEAMFLPDYLKKGFDSTLVSNRPLVGGSQTILHWPDFSARFKFLSNPFIVFSVLLLAIGGIALSKGPWTNKVLAIFDTIFFLALGVFGILMAALWIFRIDTVCRNNLNLLWALPTHIIAPFFMHRNTMFKIKYFQVVFWISIVLAFTWFFIPQQINNAVGPIILLIIIRSYHHSKKKI